MRLLFSALLILAAAASFAADEPPPDEQASGPGGVGGIVGHGINWGIGQVPFVGGIAEGLVNTGKGVVNGVLGRGAKRKAALHEDRLWQLCMAQPERYAAPCAERFPDYRGFFLLPAEDESGNDRHGANDGASAAGGDCDPAKLPLGISCDLVAGVKRRQGYRHEPYDDGTGALHVFFGHNLSANRLLFSDLVKYRRQAMRVLGQRCWLDLSLARRDVVSQLAYDHGEAGFARWDDFIPALCDGSYLTAALEMADSDWALDAGAEGLVLMEIMRRGDYG